MRVRAACRSDTIIKASVNMRENLPLNFSFRRLVVLLPAEISISWFVIFCVRVFLDLRLFAVEKARRVGG